MFNSKSSSRTVGITLVSLVALCIYFVLFELRYMWYLNISDFIFLRASIIGFILLITALWKFFPLPLLISIVGAVGLIFPPIYSSDTFAALNWGFAGCAFLSISLLIGVTYLWKDIRS
jgi:hypothetical protein